MCPRLGDKGRSGRVQGLEDARARGCNGEKPQKGRGWESARVRDHKEERVGRMRAQVQEGAGVKGHKGVRVRGFKGKRA